MAKVLLVDDEKLARNRLRRMLEQYPEYQVVAEADNGQQAIEMVQKHSIDILLMDIRMPGMDGLEAAQHMMQLQNAPAIIFCTAYDEYAIHAFDVQAVAYLLKPVRSEQLLKALEHARRINSSQLRALLPASARTHISIKNHTGIELVALDDISHFIADSKYVSGYCQGRELVLDESLKALEEEFSDRFMRVHRNCLVAIKCIVGLLRTPPGKSRIQLAGVAEPLPVSRRHLTRVKKVIKSL